MTADRIIDVLFVANVAGSLAILGVLALRGVIRRLAGARLAYFVWLMVPVVVAASFLPARIIETVIAAPVDVMAAPIVTDTSAGLPSDLSQAAPDPVPGVTSSPFDWTFALVLIWVAGALAAIVYLAARQFFAVRALGPLTRISSTTLRAAQSAIGPAVVGVFAPRIVLPANFEESFDDTERKVVLAHEEAHLRGRHTAVKTVVEIFVCLSWFNPLAYLAARAIAMDQELACDEAVAARYPGDRKAYAGALLKTQAGPRLPLGCYWPARSASKLKARIARLGLATPGQARRAAGLGAIALLAIAAGCTTWAVKPAEERFVEALAPELLHASDDVPRDFDTSNPVYLRGRIEDIQRNNDDAHILAVRAVSVARDNASPIRPNTALWRLAPLALSGDPKAVSEYLLAHRDVIVRGYRAKEPCASECRMFPVELVFEDAPAPAPQDATELLGPPLVEPQPAPPSGPQESEPAPQPGADQPAPAPTPQNAQQTPTNADLEKQIAIQQAALEQLRTKYGEQHPEIARQKELIADLQVQLLLAPARRTPVAGPVPAGRLDVFDANDTVYVLGNIEKIEFGDTTYVAYVRAHHLKLGHPYAFAQENNQLWALSPTNYFGDEANRRAILASLSNKGVDVFGARAMDKSCEPACRLQTLEMFMRPAANRGFEAGFTGLPGRIVLDMIRDDTKPIQLKGKVLRFENAEESGSPHGVLFVEALSVEPASTPGGKAGQEWRVVGIPASVIQSRFWQGAEVTVTGHNVRDKSCVYSCVMVAKQIY